MLEVIPDRYDLVIVDTPPTVVSDAMPILEHVGGVVVVGRIGLSTDESLIGLREQLDHLDAPTLGVVVNGDIAGRGSGDPGLGARMIGVALRAPAASQPDALAGRAAAAQGSGGDGRVAVPAATTRTTSSASTWARCASARAGGAPGRACSSVGWS